MEPVRADQLCIGDMLSDGTWVIDRYNDDDGLWLEFSDGDCGYVSPGAMFEIEVPFE